MTKLKAIIVALLLATPASAQPPPPPFLVKPTFNNGPPELLRPPIIELTPKRVELFRKFNFLPPPEYDHPYEGELTIMRTTRAKVHAACPLAAHAPLGCSARKPDGSICFVWIADDITLAASGWTYEIVLRHEIGHCNGWQH